MTNAHVAGDRIGRVVGIDAIVDGKTVRKNARVIEAMYSDRVIADWALLFIPEWQDLKPAYMTKTRPKIGQSLYTMGCPRCVWPPTNTDINIVDLSITNSVGWWNPPSISGQSGSAVWDDAKHYMQLILTWLWTRQGRPRGAGQMTSEIYKQQRAGKIVGAPRPTGLIELSNERDYPIDWNTEGLTDPNVPLQFYNRTTGIQDYPIWYEDQVTTPPPPPPGEDGEFDARAALIEEYRGQIEFYQNRLDALEPDETSEPDDDDSTANETDLVFGLPPL
jgi:hypothetical protein